MTGDEYSFFIDSQQHVFSSLGSALAKNDNVDGLIAIGSMASDTADVYSDCDFYIYVSDAPWSRSRVNEELRQAGLSVGAHYWTGLEKHRMLIEGVRVDLSAWPLHRIADIAFWPEIFFGEKSILKDKSGLISQMLSNRKISNLMADPENDRDAYIVNLLSISAQFIRGEVLSAKSRATGLVESKARLERSLRTGTLLWREPSRKAEESIPIPKLRELYNVAFSSNPKAFHSFLVTELLQLAADNLVDATTQKTARFYASRLGESLRRSRH